MVPPTPSKIETLNALPLSTFLTRFWAPSDDPSWHLTLHTYTTLPVPDFEAAFTLLRESVSKQYEASSLGWHPISKRREMRLPDLKYVLLKKRECGSGEVDGEREREGLGGFMSFMLTYEDGIEVVYCYEIHVERQYQGNGLGKSLMGLFEGVGRRAGVKKAMLTVFADNVAARRFYKRLGYEEDEYSPPPRKLRGGVVKWSDYLILSKSLVEDGDVPIRERKKLKIEVADLRDETTRPKDETGRKRTAG